MVYFVKLMGCMTRNARGFTTFYGPKLATRVFSNLKKRNISRCGQDSKIIPKHCPVNSKRCLVITHKKSSSAGKDSDQHKPGEQQSLLIDFEKALFRRLERAGFKRSRRFWIVFISAVVSVCGATYFYLYPYKLRQQVVEEVSIVASQSLEDEKIAMKAGQLSKDVINGILNDEQTKVVASRFVQDIITSTESRDAAVETVLNVMNDPKVLQLLSKRLSEIILNILQNEDTYQIVIAQVYSILHHSSVQKSLQDLLQDLLNTPEVRDMMATFFKDVLNSDTVKNQGKVLGQQVTTDVISSREIQQQAGDALWSAVKYSVIPRMFMGKETEKESSDAQGGMVKNEMESKTDTEPELITVRSDGYSKVNRYNIDDDIQP